MIKYFSRIFRPKATLLKFVMLNLILFSNNIFAQFELENAFPNLLFNNPLYLTDSGDSTDRIFVVEQDGIIKVFPNSVTASVAKVFLNITDRVNSSGEMGLLGLAFHPDYKNNGYFYVNYIADDPSRTIISRFKVTSNPDSADKNSEFQILVFSQPAGNHKGGWMEFRPNDGYLYISTGDGGVDANAQNINSLLGKILSIDVDSDTPYGIPVNNPFYDSTGSVKKEIYAWGFRNPWRSSFDPVTNWFWCADVGQNGWEEIDLIQKGKNYGWRCYEGNHVYNMNGCNYPEYVFPIWEYPHGPECSITGGYVYRGNNVPELVGKYVYGDYCSGKIWSLEYDGINPTTNQLLATAGGMITSFGIDQNNELYITSSNGNIYKFKPVPAPVELYTFDAVFDGSKIILKWVTKTEVNNYGFNIERRINEGEWNTIGFVEGHGNSNSQKQYNYSDKDLFAGGSKFQYRLKQIDTDGQFEYSDVVEVEIVPTQFELSQNYPNPFNPSTTIRFSLPKKTQLKIKIYNMLGELMQTLAEGTYEAGYHEITFSFSSLPSGAYIYRIESNEFVQVRKMVFLK